jgi:DNA-binding CsgD family transcriptional regulator
MLLLICLRTDAVLSIAVPLVDDAETRDPARLRAVFAASAAWMHRGETERALDLTATWLTRVRAWRRYAPLVEVQLGFVRFYTYLLAGRLLEARHFAVAGFELDHPHPPPALRAVFAMARGAAAVAQGCAQDALEALEEAADGLPGSDWFYNQELLRHALVVRATLLAGDVDRARELVAQDVGSGAGGDLVELYERPLSQAWLEVADGRISSAVDRLTEAARQARYFSPLLAASLCHEVAGLGHGEVVLGEIGSLAKELHSPFVDAIHAHARAIREGDAASLSAVADQFETFGSFLWAAEAYAQAAVALTAAGRQGAALGARERSARLRASCGDPYSPALQLAGDDASQQLTRREREIAFLAAGGASNADLAAELHLSVHTVHTHLTRIYRKLGVADRQELATHLHGGAP